MKSQDLPPRILSVEEILAADDLAEEVVATPEWGGAVKVRALTKALQQEMREQARVGGEIDSNRLEVLSFICGVVEPRFSADQYELVRRKNAGVVDRVLARVFALSGLQEDAVDAAKARFPARA